MRYTYDRAKGFLETALGDLRILSGDVVGPSDASWQDVAGTCAVNLRCLADALEQARQGNAEPFPVFPSPDEA